MIKGETINTKTHAEFLNKILNRDFKGYMRCTYRLPNNQIIWFIRLNNKETKWGWTNTLETESRILEKYTGNSEDKLESHKGLDLYNGSSLKRAVFNIIDSNIGRQYKFIGIFEYYNQSNDDNRIWLKVSDNLNLN